MQSNPCWPTDTRKWVYYAVPAEYVTRSRQCLRQTNELNPLEDKMTKVKCLLSLNSDQWVQLWSWLSLNSWSWRYSLKSSSQTCAGGFYKFSCSTTSFFFLSRSLEEVVYFTCKQPFCLWRSSFLLIKQLSYLTFPMNDLNDYKYSCSLVMAPSQVHHSTEWIFKFKINYLWSPRRETWKYLVPIYLVGF